MYTAYIPKCHNGTYRHLSPQSQRYVPMRETSSPRQIETLHPATLTVLLLTHSLSRHMMHSTETHHCTFLPMVLSRARACMRALAHGGTCTPRACCAPRWRPITAWSVCLPRGRGMGRPRPQRVTIRFCIDTNHAAGQSRCLSNE